MNQILIVDGVEFEISYKEGDNIFSITPKGKSVTVGIVDKEKRPSLSMHHNISFITIQVIKEREI